MLLDISPSLNSHHNNTDIWRGMWEGQKLTPIEGRMEFCRECGWVKELILDVFWYLHFMM